MSPPDDVLIDILLRLPADCVIRFRCVSKHWSFLTLDPNFIAAHLSRSNSNDEDDDDDDDFGLISLVEYNNEVPFDGDSEFVISREDECPAKLICLSGADFSVRSDIEIPLRARDYNWPVLCGSYNGILCLWFGDAGIALWNPAIGEAKLVPPIVRSWPLEMNSYPRLCIWFGYDSKTDDYKVLTGFISCDDACRHTHLYSLATDSWKELDQHPKFGFGRFHEANVDGVIYWYDGDVILSFDMVDEKFHKIPKPTGSGVNSLVNWKGSLGLYDCQYEIKEFHIWVLNTDRDSWSRFLKITATYLDLEPWFNSYYLIGPRKHGEIIFLSQDHAFRHWEILVFDPQTQEIRSLRPPVHWESISIFYSYKASLVTLKGAVELDELHFCNIATDPYFSFVCYPPKFAERKH